MYRQCLVLFIALLLICNFSVYAQDGYPAPPASPVLLFYIQHTGNYNTFVYEAKMANGSIPDDEPLSIYRIVYTGDNGKRTQLNSIQRKLAYGMNTYRLSANFYEMTMAASKKLKFYLVLDNTGKPKVYVTVNSRKMYLDRIFLKLKDKSSDINVKVDYALFSGKDFTTGQAVTEKVIPKK